MAAEAEQKQPAQVSGDAESPPKGQSDQSIAESIRHTDKTEPVQAGQTDQEKHE